MTERLIFSRPAWPNSVKKNFIIWPPLFSLFYFIFLWVVKSLSEWSLTSLILTEESGPYGSYDKLLFHTTSILSCLKGVNHSTLDKSLSRGMSVIKINWVKIWSSHLLDNLSNCLVNLKNSGDSTVFEPMTSAIPVQCSNQLSYEVTQLRAGQFAGLMFSREKNVVWKKCYMKSIEFSSG